MNNKKSPKANIEDKRLTYRLLGLVALLSLIYVAFEWTDRDVTVHVIESTDILDFEEEQVIQTEQNETPPPPPEPEIPDVIEEIIVVEDDVETADLAFTSEDDDKKVQEVIQAPIAAPVDEDPDEHVVFQVVEQMPEFPGGQAALMKYLSNNVRYPVAALENNIQGRVIVQFTVRRDGTIGDVQVARPVDPSLDREAVRLISNMPKWKAGMQRGKAVNCKYTVPVTFKLQ